MVSTLTLLTCQNIPGSPSAFLYAGSKVIHLSCGSKEGEPGNEAMKEPGCDRPASCTLAELGYILALA